MGPQRVVSLRAVRVNHRSIAAWATLVWLLMQLFAPPVHAHGLALPFAFWGGFSPDAAQCQRVIGFAGAQCDDHVWRIHARCLNALLNGGACEVTGVPMAAQQAQLNAVNLIDLQCTSPETQAVGFLLKFEAQTDVYNFCGVLETELVSAVYRPVLNDSVVQSTDVTTRSCVKAAADATTRLLRFAIPERRHTLDRLAKVSVAPAAKQAAVDRSTTRIAAVRGQLVASLERTCAAADFEMVYGRSVDDFLHLIATRADCFAGAVYVQSAITCPTPVCGNGMQEPGEQCDDGNLSNGDGCSSACMNEAPVP